MCLKVRHNAEKKIAEEDIIVYKILTTENTSPFRGYTYSENQTHVTELGIPERSYNPEFLNLHEGFHTFKYFGDAKKCVLSPFQYFGAVFVKIVKMTIPKGAEYYKGTWDGTAYYASSELVTTTMRGVK